MGCDIHKAPHHHGRNDKPSYPGRYVTDGGWQHLHSCSDDEHVQVRGWP